MLKKYICTQCRYVYVPYVGEEEFSILPGTDFDDIVETWVCPVCGSSKEEFEMIFEEVQEMDEESFLDIEEKHVPFFYVQDDKCFVRIGREDNFHSEDDEEDRIGFITLLDSDEQVIAAEKFPKTEGGQIHTYALDGYELETVIAGCGMHGIWKGVWDDFLLDSLSKNV